ncbi:MAG: excinuclease ABC subunit UvrC [candidate division SR1 bacterium]|nr:excinuclease ABC subunit UvrC [candidate division SR1 bacterium]
MFTIETNKIPDNAGVYLFKDRKGSILYIGKAKNLQKRLSQYFSPNSLRKQEMLEKAEKVDFLIVKNESEALYLEDNLIKQHQPEYNNLLKADNSYVYIKITKESFPQIFLTRKRINDGAVYIGPKNDTIQLKKFLQYMRQILKFRGCKPTEFKKGKLCSDYYFGICAGRCKTNVTLSETKGIKKLYSSLRSEGQTKKIEEYKNIINTITSFFKGNTKPIEKEIHEQIEIAIIHENFERAAQLRDIYQSLQGFVERQNVVLPEKKDGYLALVKTIGNKYIYTVLIFTQGKLIDVITSKEQHSDIEEDSLYLAIQRTFGEAKIEKNKNEVLISSTDLAKLGKTVKKELWKLAENFVESYIITQSMQEESTMINDMFATLKTRYGLKNMPYRIECIDISHLSGGWTSGGLSCFMAGLAYKKGYRKYKIKAKKSDDYEALQELLERRQKNGGEMPNLLVIDGGKGQLGVVKKLCKEKPKRKEIVSQIDIISLGKGEARKKSSIGTQGKKGEIGEIIYHFDENLKIHETDMIYDQADKILLKARDEAHRFANSYRKKQMSQEFR